MTPDRYRPVDTDEVLRRVDTHARVGAALLGGLGEVGHEEEDAAFTSELVTAARNAAEHELADVAYDLARACLAAHEEYCQAQVWVEAPREVGAIHAALQTLNERLGASAESFAPPSPGAQSDLRPLQSAIALCEHMEGDTDRVRLIKAQIPAVHERWDEVARLAEALMSSAQSDSTRRCAAILASFAHIKRNDGAQVIAVLNRVIEQQGAERATLANLCCGHALSGNRQGFERTAAQFARHAEEESSEYDWAEWIACWRDWFSDHLGVTGHQVERAFGLGNHP